MNLGFQEIILIFIVALLVFGPKKLPGLGKTIGKGLAEFRRASNELRNTWEEEVRIEDLKKYEKMVDPYEDINPSPPSPTPMDPLPLSPSDEQPVVQADAPAPPEAVHPTASDTSEANPNKPEKA